MKRIFTFILFFIALVLQFPSFTLHAQNWRAINTSEVFNFRLDQADVVTHSIWVDSTAKMGSDSVYYLNRVMKQLTDCINLTSNAAGCDTCCYTKNGANFLQHKVILQAGGGWLFQSPDTLLLFPNARLNDSWLMDTTHTITATVTRLYVDSVFSQPDSLKTFSLSSGDSIVLSKHHGFLNFPNGYGNTSAYALTGIEGRDLGEVVPDFWDIYDLQVGDIFEVDHSYSNGPPLESYTNRVKFTIDTRTQSGDSITFSVSGINRFTWSSYGYFSSFTNPNYSYTFTVVDSADHMANGHPGQVLINAGQRLHNYFNFVGTSGPIDGIEAHDYVKLERDPQGNIVKKMGHGDNNQLMNLAPYIPYSDILIEGSQGQYDMHYTEGLGTFNYEWFDFESIGHWYMIAYAKVGQDTVGTFTQDSILLGRRPAALLEGIQVFPNPARERVHIESPSSLRGNLQLVTLQGRVIREVPLENQFIMVDDLQAGIYLLKINTDRGNTIKKIHINH